MKVYEYVLRIKDQASDKLARLRTLSRSTVGGLGSLRRGIGQVTSSLSRAGSQLLEFTGLSASFARTFGTAAIIGGIALLSQRAVTLAADLEQTSVGFEVMLGSAERATQMIGDLREMAKFTPFETMDLIKSTETMLGFGIASEKVLPTLNMLGDVSRGNADKLRLITLAYSQIQAAGRLMGQDLLQLINAGFNPLQEISAKTGRSMAQLKKDMEDGKISAEMVTEAFKSATSQGGRFFGMMDRQSKTFHGVASTLRDEWNESLIDLGQRILPQAMAGLQRLRSILSDLRTSVDFMPFVMAMRDYRDALQDALSVYTELFALINGSSSQLSTLQTVFNTIAVVIRTSTLGLRIVLTLFKTLWNVGKSVLTVFGNVGKIIYGVATRDFGMIKDGLTGAKEAITSGLDDAWQRVSGFAKKEYEGYKAAFGGNTQQMLGIGSGANGPAPLWNMLAPGSGPGGGGGKSPGTDLNKDGIDKITGGGKQNITINIDNLVGVQNFDVKNMKESMRDLEKQVIEALLRAVNSANYAAAQ